MKGNQGQVEGKRGHVLLHFNRDARFTLTTFEGGEMSD